MKIVMNYCYDQKPFDKNEISRELLEEVLICGHYFDLPGLVEIGVDQIFYMIHNPRFI